MGAPQSPHCHYHGSVGGDMHYCRDMCHPPNNGPSYPMLMQQFVQAQQMLINSVSHCNQLMWDQQKEINNLTSAVLLVSVSHIVLKRLFF